MNRILLGVSCVVLAGVLGCGGGGGGGGAGADNVAACRAYIETFNDLSCVPAAARQNADTVCNGYMNTTCNISEYFDCMSEGTECREVVPGTETVSSPTDCGTPSCS